MYFHFHQNVKIFIELRDNFDKKTLSEIIPKLQYINEKFNYKRMILELNFGLFLTEC